MKDISGEAFDFRVSYKSSVLKLRVIDHGKHFSVVDHESEKGLVLQEKPTCLYGIFESKAKLRSEARLALHNAHIDELAQLPELNPDAVLFPVRRLWKVLKALLSSRYQYDFSIAEDGTAKVVVLTDEDDAWSDVVIPNDQWIKFNRHPYIKGSALFSILKDAIPDFDAQSSKFVDVPNGKECSFLAWCTSRDFARSVVFQEKATYALA